MSSPSLSHTSIAFIAPHERIRPLRDVIIIKPIAPKFSGVIETVWQGKPIKGEVIASGPGRYPNKHKRGEKDGKKFHTIESSKHFRQMDVKVGDIVHLEGMDRGGVPHQTVNVHGVECVMCSEQDITGVE